MRLMPLPLVLFLAMFVAACTTDADRSAKTSAADEQSDLTVCADMIAVPSSLHDDISNQDVTRHCQQSIWSQGINLTYFSAMGDVLPAPPTAPPAAPSAGVAAAKDAPGILVRIWRFDGRTDLSPFKFDAEIAKTNDMRVSALPTRIAIKAAGSESDAIANVYRLDKTKTGMVVVCLHADLAGQQGNTERVLLCRTAEQHASDAQVTRKAIEIAQRDMPFLKL